MREETRAFLEGCWRAVDAGETPRVKARVRSRGELDGAASPAAEGRGPEAAPEGGNGSPAASTADEGAGTASRSGPLLSGKCGPKNGAVVSSRAAGLSLS